MLLFGPAGLAHGADRAVVRVDPSGRTSESALRALLAAEHPALAPFTEGGRIAVNHRYAPGEILLEPGDEVALIAMVSGG